jgi:hypothetical protein
MSEISTVTDGPCLQRVLDPQVAIELPSVTDHVPSIPHRPVGEIMKLESNRAQQQRSDKVCTHYDIIIFSKQESSTPLHNTASFVYRRRESRVHEFPVIYRSSEYLKHL